MKDIENKISLWMEKNSHKFIRISIGIIFFWFGALKFFPGVSPAQDIAITTISMLTFNLMSAAVIINGLAIWEVLIGIGFLTGRFMKVALVLLFAQMLGTFAPIFLLPSEIFNAVPYAPTLEGQYIIKNIVVVSAAMVVASGVFGKGNSQ
jgi:uncharacterized membrane protein YkgB